MASVSRTIGLAALIAAAPGAASAQGVPPGSYQADVLGRVELGTEKDRLVAYATDGGPCHFDSRSRVLEGELQGNVLVGQLTVCHKGPGCPEVDTVPILALYSPEERSLTAYVRPRAGCEVPVLGKGGLMVLQPVAPGDSPAALVRTGTPVASLRTEKRNPRAAKDALNRGNRLLVENNWSGAATEFERSITHDDRSWVAFFGLGTALMKGGQPAEAVEALNRARALNPRGPNLHNTLARAYSRLGDKKQALANFAQGVKLGLCIAEGGVDPVLDKLLTSDPESIGPYVQLLQQAYANFAKAPAGRRQQTEP